MTPKKLYQKLLKKLGKQNWWPVHFQNRKKQKTEIIIGTILTQNTSWQNVEKAIKKLIENDLIDFSKIHSEKRIKIEKMIKSSGFWQQKTKKLKLFADWFKKYDFNFRKLEKKINRSPKKSRSELLNIWGIGPETADSILLYAFNQPFFVIDAYTKKLVKKLWPKQKTDYQTLQKFFEKNLPKNYKLYQEFHALIVNYSKKRKNDFISDS